MSAQYSDLLNQDLSIISFLVNLLSANLNAEWNIKNLLAIDEHVNLQLAKYDEYPKVYALAAEELKSCVEKLLSDKEDYKYKKNVEVLFVSLLVSLKPLLTAKKSSMEFSPPIFELLFDQLPISNRMFMSKFPLAHLALLKVAKLFAETNGFFSNVSSLRKNLPSFSPTDGLYSIPEVRNSKCLTEIFAVLSVLLHNGSVLFPDTIELVLAWAQAIPNSLGDAFMSILNKPQLLTFRTELFFFTFIGVKKPLAVRRVLEAVTQKYAVVGIIPQPNDSTAPMFWRKLLSLFGSVSEAEYKRIFYVLRSSALVKPFLQNSLNDMYEKRQYLLKENLFGHREFMVMTNFMLNNEPLLSNGSNESCMRAVDLLLNNLESDKSFGNDFDGWRNAVSYLALYCVENKMKTFYGKPLETFIAFDSAIRSLMNASNNMQGAEGLEYLLFPDYSDSEEEKFNNRVKLLPSEDFLRVNCFLSFVDNLEKLMSYAERGSILEVAAISESSRQFFVNNVASCQQWINRISLPLLQVCYKAGRYAQVVRFATFICHSFQQKAEVAKKALKLDDSSYLVLYWLVKAFVQLSAPQAIFGVHSFSTAVFATDLEFVWPAISAAEGRFEDALNKIEVMLEFESLHEIARNFLQELRIFVLTKIRIPSFFSKALQHHPPTAEGSSAVYGEWKRCVKFMGENQIERNDENKQGTKIREHALPWEIEARLMDFEQTLMDIQVKVDGLHLRRKNRNQKIEQSAVLENELKELGNQLNQYLYTLNMVNIPSNLHNKFAVLETIRKLISGKLSHETHKNSTNFSRRELDLIELNQSLLDKWRLNTIDRMSISHQIISWIGKLNYYDSEQAYQSHMTLTKLATKTGNFEIAKQHLFQMEEIKKSEQANMFPNYGNQTPYGMMPGSPMFSPNAFNPMPAFPMGSGFGMPVMPPLQLSPNMIAPLPLEMVVQSAKIIRLSKNKKDDGAAFFTLGNAISMQDVAMCSPSVSPAPGFQNNNAEFLDRLEKIRHAVLKLGNWASEVPNGYQRICETNKYQPNPLWDMIIKRFNILGNVVGDTTAEKTLEGALYWLATEMGANLTNRQLYFAKAHRKLAEWSLEQLYKDEDGTLNLTVTEFLGLQTFGISYDHIKFKDFLKLLTLSTDFASFKIEAMALLETVSMSAFESLSFERLWNTIKQRQATLFDISLKGHLHFLAQQSAAESQRSIHTVTATLQILKMLINHPDLFEITTQGQWLADTNENIWKDIIPQLFARLNNPNDKVRKAICDLLKKICITSPHAICFPAIVGAYFSRSIFVQTEAENENMTATDGEMNEGFDIVKDVKQDRSRKSAACVDIVESLQQQYPDLVKDVTTFIRELQRINMLNEEKWMFVLNNLDMEMTRRLRQLEIQDQRTFTSNQLSVNEKNAISEKRAEIVTGVISQILEDFYNSTFKTAEESDVSLNEAAFREEFERDISAALKYFMENRIKSAKNAWMPFKKLVSIFNQRASKKSSLSLNINDMSPFLASMRNTSIPVPGQELSNSNIVTIASMKEQVSIMVTKTRPKKLTFIGSNGKEYVFLFKGQEDLHLDERVMQFIQICNLMLSDKKNISAEDAWPPYVCRNYSVTPIGIRSGLIQWVGGATSMFQIYRKWKTRQANRDAVKSSEKQEDRPMDMFFKQLKSVFQANNVPLEVQQDRKQWSVPILKQVLEQLMAATPKDILSKELWMAAGNSETFWRVTQRFARSTAVASMVGAIIGLGDRHMENLLINLGTGEVVHIDYNVCFDKGRHLRVPETVPFRISSNILNAMGFGQINGTFRQSCEHVIQVLRSGKETLLALLDAFVYDPVVDWTMQDQLATAKVNISTLLAVYGNGNCNNSCQTNVQHEEENAHAKMISKRIRLRLEGKEYLPTITDSFSVVDTTHLKYDEGPEMTASEQVDMLIDAATNPNNLCLLYEGWTAWV